MKGMNFGFLILVYLCLFVSSLFSQSQNWIWASNPLSSGSEYGNDTAVDDVGNTYITGACSAGTSITFGQTTLTESMGFVAKLSNTGQWIWAKGISGIGNAIAVDHNGDVIVLGSFGGTMVFDDIVLNDTGLGSDLFVAKLAPSGDWLWATKSVTNSASGVSPQSIEVNTNNSIYIVGFGWGSSVFDEQYYGDNGNGDILTGKLSSSGDWLWVRNAGSTYQDYGYDIAVDNIGNAYVTGKANSGSGMNGDFSSVVVVKYDAEGTMIWQITSTANGGSGYSNVSTGRGIATDGEYLYITGNYIRYFQICGVPLPYANPERIFVLKLTMDGSYVWLNQYNISGQQIATLATSIECDPWGSLYLLTDYGSGRVAKVDNSGNWIGTILSGTNIYPLGLDIDSSGAVCVSGRFIGSATFGSATLTSSGESDAFVAKMNSLHPLASFRTNLTEGLEPLLVQFEDTSISGWGAISNWLWDFGDGTTSTDQHPDHVYQQAELYDVSLTVTNELGLTSSIIRIDYINVIPRFPVLVAPSSFNVGTAYIDYFSDSDELWVSNTGTANLIIESASFLNSITPFSIISPTLPCTIPDGDSIVIVLRFSPQTPGTMTDSLFIYNNSNNMPLASIRLTGNGIIVPPLPPVIEQISILGYDVVIGWSAVTETIFNTPISPDYYFIYHSYDPCNSYTLMALTPNLSYTHPNIALGARRMFYKVTAVKFFRNYLTPSELDSYLKNNITPGMAEADVRAFLNRIK